ncbi:putative reverse transcriptase domain-containing protein [Tanacetum coccineum]|uniref:Reverse transcriptase domain-containing protein n=1 Tax=Tanacetum coccineum TaxID=301880 RepID=A0ABQ5A7H8_9ASTR
MLASRQGTSSEEMEQVIAQRVANAIEAIAIYQSKIRMAHDLMNQVIREETTVRKNVCNKRKWVSDHGRDSDQQQSKRIELVRAHATGAGKKKAYARNLPYCNKCDQAINMPTSGQSLNAAAIEQLITQRVTEAITAYEANQNNQNKDGNPHVNAGGFVPVARECTYQDFVKCQPLNFKGTEGVVGLTRWFEKMETRIIGTDAAYAMTWKALMKLMTEVYCPRNEIQKMETKLWNLSLKGNDLTAYTQRLQDAIRIANNLMDQKLKGYAARDAKNKRRFNNNPKDNRVQQPPLKRQNVARGYTVGNNKNKGYARILPLCDKGKLHHHGLCPVRCGNCKKVGHQARDCWASTMMTCYGCGGKGHTKRYFPELGNQNGDGEARQNLDIVMELSFNRTLFSNLPSTLDITTRALRTKLF